jgi:hypothetical protein
MNEEKKQEEQIEGLTDKELELFKKLVPYLFADEPLEFLKWIPLFSLILEFIMLLVIIFKIK